jgi:hypothetical protein
MLNRISSYNCVRKVLNSCRDSLSKHAYRDGVICLASVSFVTKDLSPVLGNPTDVKKCRILISIRTEARASAADDEGNDQ